MNISNAIFHYIVKGSLGNFSTTQVPGITGLNVFQLCANLANVSIRFRYLTLNHIKTILTSHDYPVNIETEEYPLYISLFSVFPSLSTFLPVRLVNPPLTHLNDDDPIPLPPLVSRLLHTLSIENVIAVTDLPSLPSSAFCNKFSRLESLSVSIKSDNLIDLQSVSVLPLKFLDITVKSSSNLMIDSFFEFDLILFQTLLSFKIKVLKNNVNLINIDRLPFLQSLSVLTYSTSSCVFDCNQLSNVVKFESKLASPSVSLFDPSIILSLILIADCGNFLNEYFNNLKFLKLVGVSDLIELKCRYFPSLNQLIVKDCSNLTSIDFSDCRELGKLTLSGCRKLSKLTGYESLSGLTQLIIDSLIVDSDWIDILRHFNHLSILSLDSFQESDSLITYMSQSNKLSVGALPSIKNDWFLCKELVITKVIERFPDLSFFPFLESLDFSVKSSSFVEMSTPHSRLKKMIVRANATNFRNFCFIEYFPNLTVLSLNECRAIRDFDFLQTNHLLKVLVLNNLNLIQDVKILSKLHSLKIICDYSSLNRTLILFLECREEFSDVWFFHEKWYRFCNSKLVCK
ncbi:hypothetical protein RCL1_004470 [Eukaryota sp. TZLM3-RCL]